MARAMACSLHPHVKDALIYGVVAVRRNVDIALF